MYNRDEGLKRLHEIKNSLIEVGEYDYEAIATVSIKFDLFGRDLLENHDLAAFHDAQRLAKLKLVEPPMRYELDIRCKALAGQENPDNTDHVGAAIAKGYTQARIVLAGLAASARCLILRRHLTFLHGGVHVAISGKPNLSRVEFGHEFPNVESQGSIDAGNLCAAITALAMFNSSWSEAFLHNYESGQMFLLSPMEFNPLHPNGFSHFLSEAYLSFFRCLEYIVMVKVLGERGQFKGFHLRRAFEHLDCKTTDGNTPPSDILKVHGDELIRKRGQYAAHLLTGAKPGELNHQDVYKLKELVDFLFCTALACSSKLH
jgi:hypothetical protein